MCVLTKKDEWGCVHARLLSFNLLMCAFKEATSKQWPGQLSFGVYLLGHDDFVAFGVDELVLKESKFLAGMHFHA